MNQEDIKQMVFALRDAAPSVEKEYCSPFGLLMGTAADMIESLSQQLADCQRELDAERERRFEGNRISSEEHAAELAALKAEMNKLSEQGPVAWNQAGKPLYLHPAPSVPEGYQLVPIEPTKAMMWALYGHWVGHLTQLDYGYYKAMLSAARSE